MYTFSAETHKISNTAVPYPGQPSGSKAYTLLVWYRRSAADATQKKLLDFKVNGSGGLGIDVNNIPANDWLRFGHLDDNSVGWRYASVTPQPLAAGTLRCLVCVFDPTQIGTQLQLYLDGTPTPIATNALAGLTGTTTVQFTLGALYGDQQNCRGSIYELAYWKGSALNAAQVGQLLAGAAPDTIGLNPTLYWPLQADANDRMGSYHGTVSGAVFTAHTDADIPGRVPAGAPIPVLLEEGD